MNLKKIFSSEEIGLLLEALQFAAIKHRHQRRKNSEAVPYINHPIEVAITLWQVGGIREITTLMAALLHDTLEDTDASAQEILAQFGDKVLHLVQEVTDDKNLSKQQRKLKQIETAPNKSIAAKQIKLADKICNIYDVAHSPPRNWSLERRQEYLDWTMKVIAGLRGTNSALETHYDTILSKARATIAQLNN
ncbi:MAG TPA: bifunctional (p)ppGpp synthetase/guanosine-3',5'-bis(diphosphate) 3'-pyrophosphohydrolase [Thioploca sp.]|nr:bifunctional (p)ppGpp synthetase/guanosine-3',5'-bis(diphosphate) 3'-pyrophosphohydrolase [Thioploca sp.]